MVSSYNELELKEYFKDNLNTSTYKLQQKWKDIPVYGNMLILHTDKNNTVTSVTGNYDADIIKVSIETSIIKPEDAQKAAIDSIKSDNTNIYDISKCEAVRYKDRAGKYRQSYHVEISAFGSNASYSNQTFSILYNTQIYAGERINDAEAKDKDGNSLTPVYIGRDKY